ncbi:TBC1 domain family member 8-like [Sciurus carolinensis]|uniref:TBC1 domain family member 8-like n=1 Tax=Sciurus carolinensis TaxID=30640 RepID=UPI001FB40DE0|nr:TBC1 domain family member 8-like [Sciurus carolinensis]
MEPSVSHMPGSCCASGPVGALEAVLDSNTEVAPFRVLLQVPGSQVYSPIACGEFLDGCDVHWAIATGATLEKINQHWNWLGQNLLHTLSVFDYKDDMASFVKGKVKVGPLISTFSPSRVTLHDILNFATYPQSSPVQLHFLD